LKYKNKKYNKKYINLKPPNISDFTVGKPINKSIIIEWKMNKKLKNFKKKFSLQ